jgi:hypothetical protein
MIKKISIFLLSFSFLSLSSFADYSLDYDDDLILETEEISDVDSRCSRFRVYDRVLVREFRRYQRPLFKTAEIISKRGCIATVQYYGHWFGRDRVNLRDGSVTFQRRDPRRAPRRPLPPRGAPRRPHIL